MLDAVNCLYGRSSRSSKSSSITSRLKTTKATIHSEQEFTTDYLGKWQHKVSEKPLKNLLKLTHSFTNKISTVLSKMLIISFKLKV